MNPPAVEVDVLVVGGGPAGLACATELASLGHRVLLAEREVEAGGVPRITTHPGFGLRDLHRLMDGPAYAARWVARAAGAGVDLWTSATVTDWADPPEPGVHRLGLTLPDGRRQVVARAVVLATGCRERPRHARLVAGERPAGVLTTGSLQHLAVAGLPIGRRAVVVGAEHVSFSAVVTLRHHRVAVAAMVTEGSRHTSVPGARLVLGRTPLVTGRTVARLHGATRLEAVELDDGRHIPADTVVFTGDWTAELGLARAGDLAWDPSRRQDAARFVPAWALPVTAAGDPARTLKWTPWPPSFTKKDTIRLMSSIV